MRWIGLLMIISLSGCEWLKAHPRAPLVGGEQLTFALWRDTVRSQGTITFEPKGGGFLVKTDSAGYPPQRVGPGLSDPFVPIRAFDLQALWLPPAMHGIGQKTSAGLVLRHEAIKGRTLTVVAGQGGLVELYFDGQTGFLVALRSVRFPAYRFAQLVSTTIAGLQVTEVPNLRQGPIR